MTQTTTEERLTEVDLALLVPARVLEAGRDYFSLGRVRDRVRSGGTIAATVQGEEPYRVRARPDAPREAHCTCPARPRPCKHVAALLLAWIRERETFADLDAVAAHLAARPERLRQALEEAFLGDGDAPLATFARAVQGNGTGAPTRAPGWDDVPLDVLLEAFAPLPVPRDRRAGEPSRTPSPMAGEDGAWSVTAPAPPTPQAQPTPPRALPLSEEAELWDGAAARLLAGRGEPAETAEDAAPAPGAAAGGAHAERAGLAEIAGLAARARDITLLALWGLRLDARDAPRSGRAGPGADADAVGPPEAGAPAKGGRANRAVRALLECLRAVRLSDAAGTGEGAAQGARRAAFDAAAVLACALEARRKGDGLRVLRRAWRLLPGEEAARRWFAVTSRLAARALEVEAPGATGAAAQGKAREPALPRAAAVRMMAAGWTEAGRPDLARAVWELHGDLPEADEGRVRAAVARGDWRRAADEARAGLARAPEERAYWFRRQEALALERLGDHRGAVVRFAANFEESPTVRAYRDLRGAARAAGEWAEIAMEAAERLAQANWPVAPGAPIPDGAPHRWASVARAIAEDAPLLALRYLAAALSASGGGDAAGDLRALGDAIAAGGSSRLRDAWRRLANL